MPDSLISTFSTLGAGLIFFCVHLHPYMSFFELYDCVIFPEIDVKEPVWSASAVVRSLAQEEDTGIL